MYDSINDSEIYTEINDFLYDIMYDESIVFVDDDELEDDELTQEDTVVEEVPFIDFPTTDDIAQA